MPDWERYWSEYPKTHGETEFLKHVGTTVNGKPYSEEEFNRMVLGIAEQLELRPGDDVLDVCCGNGVVTAQLAKKCRHIAGVDFSDTLLDIASRYHRPANVAYYKLNALRLDALAGMANRRFNKVLMYGALQCIQYQDLEPMLRNIVRLTSQDRIVLLGSIPDKRRKRFFFNTIKRKVMSLVYTLRGRDAMGTWWDEDFIRQTCNALGLESRVCVFEDSTDLPSSH